MAKYHIEVAVKKNNNLFKRSFISLDDDGYEEFTRSVQDIKMKKDKI